MFNLTIPKKKSKMKLILILSLLLTSCSITKVLNPSKNEIKNVEIKSTEEKVQDLFEEQDLNKDGYIDPLEFSQKRKEQRNVLPTISIIAILSSVIIICISPKLFELFEKFTNTKFRKK
jgi:hypothetical protein